MAVAPALIHIDPSTGQPISDSQYPELENQATELEIGPISARDNYFVLDNGLDQSANILAALTAGNEQRRIVSFSGLGEVTMTRGQCAPSYCVIDLAGATLKPTGNTPAFVHASLAATASGTISSGATQGSRSVVVTSATGLVVGQRFSIAASNAPAEPAGAYPRCWRKITDIAGTTVTLDTTLPLTYTNSGVAGAATFNAYNALNERFEIRNGTIDGSACRYITATGQALRLRLTEKILVEDMRFDSFTNGGDGGSTVNPVTVLGGVWVQYRYCQTVNGYGRNPSLYMEEVEDAMMIGCRTDGAHFGIEFVRCPRAKAIANTIHGRRRQELDLGIGVDEANSTRGIKFFGCTDVMTSSNAISDVETAIKIEACDRLSVNGDVARNCAVSGFTSVVIAISSGVAEGRHGEGSINGVIVDGAGGVGIGVQNGTKGRITINAPVLRNCGSNGIYSDEPDITVNGGDIVDWGNGTTTYSAIHLIHATGHHTITGVRFTNASATPRCLTIVSPNIKLSNNWAASGNPLTPERVVSSLNWQYANIANAADANYVTSTVCTLSPGTLAAAGDRLRVEYEVVLSATAGQKNYKGNIGYSAFDAATGDFTDGLSLGSFGTNLTSQTAQVLVDIVRITATTVTLHGRVQYGTTTNSLAYTGPSTLICANAQNVLIAAADGSGTNTAAMVTIKEVRISFWPAP